MYTCNSIKYAHITVILENYIVDVETHRKKGQTFYFLRESIIEVYYYIRTNDI